MTDGHRTVRVSGGEMAWVDVGEGPPVVLLHGFPTSSFLWRGEIPLLATRMRVLAPDLIGYGASEKPKGADLSEPAQARYVAEALESWGVDRFAVVGHDVGGAVAQLLALDGRFEVPALVLIDAACFDAWPAAAMRRLQEAAAEQEGFGSVRTAVKLAFDRGMGHREFLTEADLQSYLEPWREDPAAFFRAARGIRGGCLAGRDEELHGLDADAMVIWGEDDPFLPADLAERLGEVLGGATVALLPGCSHFVTEDAPRTVGPLAYEFLRSRYVGEGHAHVSAPIPVTVSLERPPPDSDPFDGDG